MDHILPGFTQDQLDDAQARYGVRFPSDLVEVLRERRLDARYDWSVECPAISKMLNWPFEMLQFDVENGFWWPDWGDRPALKEERDEVLRSALRQAPELIPLHAHRFLPDTPGEPGNPVFSMHGFDTMYYGDNLAGYLKREFGWRRGETVSQPRQIPFWSDLAEGQEKAYDFYARNVEQQHAEGPSRESSSLTPRPPRSAGSPACARADRHAARGSGSPPRPADHPG
ncbi:MAG TPA: hypothetical protein VGB54_03935 [Allosphingosinicella sp.]|jgi:hypothetical protein